MTFSMHIAVRGREDFRLLVCFNVKAAVFSLTSVLRCLALEQV